jgi:outer membrane protein assembly factor BamB
MRHESLSRLATPSLLLASVLIGSSIRAEDWPRFRGVSADGISKEKNWLGAWPGGQPKSLWKKNVGTGFASMTVSGGHLFTTGHSGKEDRVYCLDAATGAEVWNFAYAQSLDPKYYEGGPSATPTVDAGRVYVLGKQGDAFCLDAATGKPVWSHNLHKEHGAELPDWGFASSAHIEGDLVIFNAGLSGIALRKDTGEKVWVSGKEASGYATPVPIVNDGKRALAFFGAKQVFGVEPRTGKVLWQFPWVTDYDVNAADPVASGDLLFLSSGYGKGGGVIRFGQGKAQQVWFNTEVRAHFSSPVVIGGHVYGVDAQGGDRDSKLKCLDLKTGKVVWQSPASSTGSLIAADGKLLWLTGAGELVVAEATPAGYRELARAQVTGGKCWTSPVLSNGKVYVRNAKGDVVCVDVKGDGKVG